MLCNYDPLATIDDGSCGYKGCTDPAAVNYDPNATSDDGSCEYEGGEPRPNGQNNNGDSEAKARAEESEVTAVQARKKSEELIAPAKALEKAPAKTIRKY